MITIIKETLLGYDWGKNIGRVGLVAALALGMMLTLAACGGSTDSAGQPAVTATDTAPASSAAISTDTPATTDTTGGSIEATQAPADTGSSATPTSGSQAGQSGGSVTEIQGTLKEWAIDLS